MSNPSAEKERTDSAEEYGSDSGVESPPPQPPRRQRRQMQRTQQREKSSSQGSGGPLGALDNLPVAGEVGQTAGGALGGVTNALGGVTNNAVGQQGGGEDKGKSDTLRLRLDLNLDIEIQLKAKIHGDLELALL
ncbi:hypothetical protein ACHAQJ_010066 [Trichoderma viride]